MRNVNTFWLLAAAVLVAILLLAGCCPRVFLRGSAMDVHRTPRFCPFCGYDLWMWQELDTTRTSSHVNDTVLYEYGPVEP